MHRRTFLALGVPAVTAWRRPSILYHDSVPSIKAILFDAFSIFDPSHIALMAGRLFPGKGPELIREWRTRQFEYAWLRSMTHCYVDFQTITSDALDYATQLLKMDISPRQHQQLVDGFFELSVWPEVPLVLGELTKEGYRLGILSNFTPEMLRVNTNGNRITGYFENLISVDSVKRYKPDPLTYQMGMDLFHLHKEEILFAPFAAWDAAGAKNFDYTTFWVNRSQMLPERIAALPDGEGRDLKDMIRIMKLSDPAHEGRVGG